MKTHIDLGQPRTEPLQGVRVADFSAIFSGPIAGAMLADQGADVIKVEAFGGDLMRRGFPQSGGMARFRSDRRDIESWCSCAGAHCEV